MNLLNAVVIHKSLGKGTVISQDDKYIRVEVHNKICQFQYPEAFRNFLKVEDEEVHERILLEIEMIDIKKLEAKRQVEEQRRMEETKRLEALAQKAKHKNIDKIIKRMERDEGTNTTFLVFQGDTFEVEYRGGFIWAPKYNKVGGTCHHWERLLDVRKGDLIIHCANGYIQAVSVVEKACYDANSPRELLEEELWEKDGRMVDCKYIKLEKPIKHSEYKDTIVQYSNVKYAPFDKDGNGNMGYLYEVDKELAKFFVEIAIIKNGYLLDVECIQNFIK